MGARPLTCWPGWGFQGCPRPAASSTQEVLGGCRMTSSGLLLYSAPAAKFHALRRSPRPPTCPLPPPGASGLSLLGLPLAHHRPTLESSSSPRSPRPPGGPGIRPGVSSAGRKSGRGRGGSRTLIGHTRPASAPQGPSRPFKASSRPSLPPQLPPLPPRPATGPRQRERCSRSRPREPRVGVNCPREHSAPCPASLLPGCRAAVRPWHWPSCLTNGSTVLSARH